MRTFHILFGIAAAACAFVSASPASAQSYCCKINPAICTAMCGAACCSKGSNTLSAGGNSPLSSISLESLQSEYDAASASRSGDVADRLKQELDRRKKAPAAVKAK